jgi:hypothetical protein
MDRGLAAKLIIMKAAIYLHGLYIMGQPVTDQDKPKAVKTVEYTDEKALIAHLKQLQSGYSEDGRDRPKIERHTLPGKKEGTTRIVIDCHTSADWHYVAHVGLSIKAECGLPLETI